MRGRARRPSLRRLVGRAAERLVVRGRLDEVVALEEGREPLDREALGREPLEREPLERALLERELLEDRADEDDEDFELLDEDRAELDAFESLPSLSLGAASATAGCINSAVRSASDHQFTRPTEVICLAFLGPAALLLDAHCSLSWASIMTCLLHGSHPVSPSPVQPPDVVVT